jgi:vacuolar protein-sorting-associated protein 4
MTDPSKRRKEYSDFLEKAKECEDSEDFDQAFNYYLKASNTLQLLYKYEEHNAKLKQIYKDKLREVIGRAEEVKKHCKGKKKVVKAGGGGKSGKSKKQDNSSDEEDKGEDDELRKGIVGAIIGENPDVHWDDVAGLEGAKSALKEAVILPTRYPQLFAGERKPWTGILLYGPPGTGKSFLAKACATEAKGTFFSIKSSDLLSKFLGETEKQVKNLFEIARERKPSIIFIDEIDSICGARGEGEHETMRRVKTEILVQMQGVGTDNKNVLVLGATNLPWEIDPAVRRRFERRIYISLPDEHSRKEIVRHHLGETPHNLEEEDLELVATQTEGFSGSDLATLTKDAIMAPLRKCQEAVRFVKTSHGTYLPTYASDKRGENITMLDMDPTLLEAPPIVAEDFQSALIKTKATVAQSDLLKFEEWTEEFGQDG